MEADAFEDNAVGVVVEADILERDIAAADAEGASIRRILYLGRRIGQAEHRIHIDQPLPDGAIDHAEQIERAEKLRQQRVDQHDIASAEHPLRPSPHRIAHRARHHQIGDQRLADVEPGEAVFRRHGGVGIAADGGGIAGDFALFGGEIFDRLVIEQAVDRAADGDGIERVHLRPKRVAPVGDAAGERQIGDDHHCRCQRQPDAEFQPEDDQHRDQLDRRRGDVEQQEIEHGVDALGPPLDDLGHLPRAAREVEAERQAVEVSEDRDREVAGRILADAFEHRVAQIVEQDAGEPRACVSRDQPDGERHGGLHPRLHPVDRGGVDEAHRQLHRFRQQHEQPGNDDACALPGIIAGPQIGQEARQRGERGGFRGIGVDGRLRGHRPQLGAWRAAANSAFQGRS